MNAYDIFTLGVSLQAVWLGIISATLIIFLVIWIQRASTTALLARHRSKDAGLADLLIYASLVKDDVILGKDGSFMAAWLLRGRDPHGATEAEIEDVSLRINEALKPLGTGWVVHIDAVRE